MCVCVCVCVLVCEKGGRTERQCVAVTEPLGSDDFKRNVAVIAIMFPLQLLSLMAVVMAVMK